MADKVKSLLCILNCIMVHTLTIIIEIRVVNRYAFGTPSIQAEEPAGMVVVYIIYFDAAVAIVSNSNTRIDFFIHKLPGPMYRGFEILNDCICLASLLIIRRYAIKLMSINLHALLAAMKILPTVNYVGALSGYVLTIVFYSPRPWIDVEKLQGRSMDYAEEELGR